MEPYKPYKSDASSGTVVAGHDLVIWLATSLLLALTPYAIVSLLFRALYSDHGQHSFPSFTMLFGKGELLLVIVSVTGATLAELWRNPWHMRSLSKVGGVAVSIFIALAAGALFVAIVYESLTNNPSQLDSHFVAQLSLVLLVLVVLIQAITLLTRPRHKP